MKAIILSSVVLFRFFDGKPELALFCDNSKVHSRLMEQTAFVHTKLRAWTAYVPLALLMNQKYGDEPTRFAHCQKCIMVSSPSSSTDPHILQGGRTDNHCSLSQAPVDTAIGSLVVVQISITDRLS